MNIITSKTTTPISDLVRLASDLCHTPWDMQESAHFALYSALRSLDPLEIGPPQAPRKENPFRGSVEKAPNGRTAVMHIEGPLYRKIHPILKGMLGITDLNDINHDISALADDPNLETVIFDIDSPGGMARPSTETAELIKELGEKKRTVAYSSGTQASAGYKLAAACDENYASKSADVGCVGTYVAMVDDSEHWAKKGYKLEMIRDGVYKGMGHPGKPITAEERALMEEEVKSLSGAFKDFVRENRPGVSESALQGQTLSGSRAKKAGLIDGIHRDLSSLVAAEIRRPLTL